MKDLLSSWAQGLGERERVGKERDDQHGVRYGLFTYLRAGSRTNKQKIMWDVKNYLLNLDPERRQRKNSPNVLNKEFLVPNGAVGID